MYICSLNSNTTYPDICTLELNKHVKLTCKDSVSQAYFCTSYVVMYDVLEVSAVHADSLVNKTVSFHGYLLTSTSAPDIDRYETSLSRFSIREHL